MNKVVSSDLAERFAKDSPHRLAMEKAHYDANRRALLEHARMGRSVPVEGKTEKVVWLSPAEIFAIYGLDEFGRPQTAAE
jgi:hypothetical protein